MDPATHTLYGATASAVLQGGRNRMRIAALVVLASLLPDIDILWAFSDPISAVLNRRMFTHSILGIMAISGVLAFLVRKLFPGTSWLALASLCASGMALHVLLDLINAYGVGLFYPLSNQRFDFPLVFVLDPILLLIGAIGVFATATTSVPKARRTRALASLVAACLYLLVCLGARITALDMARSNLSEQASQTTLNTIIPEPLAPLRWRAIIPVEQGYRQLVLFPFSGSVTDLGVIQSNNLNTEVAKIRKSGAALRIGTLLKFPVWETVCGKIVVHDLRYRYATLQNQWDPFGFAFDPGSEDESGGLLVPNANEQYGKSLDVLSQIDWWTLLSGNFMPRTAKREPSC